MEPFKTSRSFKTIPSKIEKEKIYKYFEAYGFKAEQKSNNQFLFYKKGSLLEGWKMNPLNWESEIELFISGDEIRMTYVVEGLYITPIAFKSLYHGFLERFVSNLQHNTSYRLENKIALKKAKQQLLGINLFYLLCILITFTVIGVLEDMFHSKAIGFLLLVGALFFLEKGLNAFLENKYS